MKTKTNFKRRLISGLLALVMVLGFLPAELVPVAYGADALPPNGALGTRVGEIGLSIESNGTATVTLDSTTAGAKDVTFAIVPAFTTKSTAVQDGIAAGRLNTGNTAAGNLLTNIGAYYDAELPIATHPMKSETLVNGETKTFTVSLGSNALSTLTNWTNGKTFHGIAPKDGVFTYILLFVTGASNLQWTYATVSAEGEPNLVSSNDIVIHHAAGSIVPGYNPTTKITNNGSGDARITKISYTSLDSGVQARLSGLTTSSVISKANSTNYGVSTNLTSTTPTQSGYVTITYTTAKSDGSASSTAPTKTLTINVTVIDDQFNITAPNELVFEGNYDGTNISWTSQPPLALTPHHNPGESWWDGDQEAWFRWDTIQLGTSTVSDGNQYGWDISSLTGQLTNRTTVSNYTLGAPTALSPGSIVSVTDYVAYVSIPYSYYNWYNDGYDDTETPPEEDSSWSENEPGGSGTLLVKLVARLTPAAAPATYTVTFEAGAPGTAVTDLPAQKTGVASGTTLAYNNAAAGTVNPSCTGYTFQGWDTNGDGTADWTSGNLTVTSDVTCTAIWKKLKQATFDPNGGNWSGSTTPIVVTAGSDDRILASTATGTTAKAPADPSRAASAAGTQYDFKGWYTAATSGTKVTFPALLTADTNTYYAQWDERYTVKFDLNAPSTDAVTPGSITAMVQSSVGQTLTMPAAPTSAGAYVFAGWKPNNTGSTIVAASGAYKPTNNVTMYAQWEKTYAVVYYDQTPGGATPGGTIPANVSGLTNGQTHTVSTNVLTLSGWKFLGWATSPTGTPVTGTLTISNANIELYGIWKELPKITSATATGTIRASQPVTLSTINLSDSTTLAASDVGTGKKVTTATWYLGSSAGDSVNGPRFKGDPIEGTDTTPKSSITVPSTAVEGDCLWVLLGGNGTDVKTDKIWVKIEVGENKLNLNVGIVVLDTSNALVSTTPSGITASGSGSISAGKTLAVSTVSVNQGYEFLGWSAHGDATAASNLLATGNAVTSGDELTFSAINPSGMNSATYTAPATLTNAVTANLYAVYREIPAYPVTIKLQEGIESVTVSGTTASGGTQTLYRSTATTHTVNVRRGGLLTIASNPATGYEANGFDHTGTATVVVDAKTSFMANITSNNLEVTAKAKLRPAILTLTPSSGDGSYDGGVVNHKPYVTVANVGGADAVAIQAHVKSVTGVTGASTSDFPKSAAGYPNELGLTLSKGATTNNIFEISPATTLQPGTYKITVEVTYQSPTGTAQDPVETEVTYVVSATNKFTGNVTVRLDNAAWNAATVALTPNPSSAANPAGSKNPAGGNTTEFKGLDKNAVYTITVKNGTATYPTNVTLTAANPNVTVDFFTISAKMNKDTEEEAALTPGSSKATLSVADGNTDTNAGTNASKDIQKAGLGTVTASRIVLKGSAVTLNTVLSQTTTGYVFEKWTVDSDASWNSTSPNTVIVADKAKTYTAHLTTGEQVKVKYLGNGNNAPFVDSPVVVNVPSIEVVNVGTTNHPVTTTVPTLAGYIFKEWNTKADGTGDSYASGATIPGPLNGDLELYAQWESVEISATNVTNKSTVYGDNYSDPTGVSAKAVQHGQTTDLGLALKYSAPDLPAGLVIDADTGRIYGRPHQVTNTAVTAHITVTLAQDYHNTANKVKGTATYAITVEKAQPIITSVTPSGNVASGANINTVAWTVTVVGPQYDTSKPGNWEDNYVDTITYKVGFTNDGENAAAGKTGGLGKVSFSPTTFATSGSSTTLTASFTPLPVGTGAGGAGDFDSHSGNKQSTVWKPASKNATISHNGDTRGLQVSTATDGTGFADRQSWLYAQKDTGNPAHKGYTAGTGADGFVTIPATGSNADTVNAKDFTIKATGNLASGNLEYEFGKGTNSPFTVDTTAGSGYLVSSGTTSLNAGGMIKIRVKPNTGLGVGTHTDTLTISDDKDSTAVIYVTFVVTEAKTFDAIITVSTKNVAGTAGSTLPTSPNTMTLKVGTATAVLQSTGDNAGKYVASNLSSDTVYSVSVEGTAGGTYTVPGKTISAPTTAHANEATVQLYEVTTAKDPSDVAGTQSGAGWYVSGQTATISTPQEGNNSADGNKPYVFDQWQWGTTPSTSKSLQYSQAIADAVAFTAKYTKKDAASVTITYHRNYDGSDSTVLAAETKSVGDKYKILSMVPTRPGYKFLYWTTAQNGTGTKYSNPAQAGTADEIASLSAAVDLYAQWEPVTLTWATSSDSMTGTYGVYVNHALPALTVSDGGSVTYSIDTTATPALPGGLYINPATGAIYGTPYEVTEGTGNETSGITVTVKATYTADNSLTETIPVTIKVNKYQLHLTNTSVTNVVSGQDVSTGHYEATVVPAPILTTKGSANSDGTVHTADGWDEFSPSANPKKAHLPADAANDIGTLSLTTTGDFGTATSVGLKYAPSTTEKDNNNSTHETIYRPATATVTPSAGSSTYTMTVKEENRSPAATAGSSITMIGPKAAGASAPNGFVAGVGYTVDATVTSTSANGTTDGSNKVQAQLFTLTNTGNQATGALHYRFGTAAADDTAGEYFTIGTGDGLTLTGLAASGTETFTVAPLVKSPKLEPGTYRDTLVISSGHYSVSVALTLTVTAGNLTATVKTYHWDLGVNTRPGATTNLAEGQVKLVSTDGDTSKDKTMTSTTAGVYTASVPYAGAYFIEINGYRLRDGNGQYVILDRNALEKEVDLYRVTTTHTPAAGAAGDPTIRNSAGATSTYIVAGDSVSIAAQSASAGYTYKELQKSTTAATATDRNWTQVTTSQSYVEKLTGPAAFQAVYDLSERVITGATIGIHYPLSNETPDAVGDATVDAVTKTAGSPAITAPYSNYVNIKTLTWNPDTKFNTTERITVVAVLEPKNGWSFVTDKDAFTGKFADKNTPAGATVEATVVSCNANEAVIMYTFSAENKLITDKINVNTTNPAVDGYTTGLSVNDTDAPKYYVDQSTQGADGMAATRWVLTSDVAGSTPISSTNKFAASTNYDLIAVVHAQEGYEFDPAVFGVAGLTTDASAVATVNGGNPPESPKTTKVVTTLSSDHKTLTIRYSSFVPVAKTVSRIEWAEGNLTDRVYYAMTATDTNGNASGLNIGTTGQNIYGHTGDDAKFSRANTIKFNVYYEGETSATLVTLDLNDSNHGLMYLDGGYKSLPANGHVFTNDTASGTPAVSGVKDQTTFDGKQVYIKYTESGKTVYAAVPGSTLTVQELKADKLTPSRAWTTAELTFVGGQNFAVPTTNAPTANVDFNTGSALANSVTGWAYAATPANGGNKHFYSTDVTDAAAAKTAELTAATVLADTDDGKTVYMCYIDINGNLVYAPVGTLKVSGNTGLKVWIDNPSDPTDDDAVIGGATGTAGQTGGSSEPEYGETIKAVIVGTPAGPVEYQWYREGATPGTWTLITGETDPTHTVSPEDIGKQIKVEIKEKGTSGGATSVNFPVGQKRTLKLDVTAVNKNYDGTATNGHTYATGNPATAANDFYLYNVINNDTVYVSGYTGTKPNYTDTTTGADSAAVDSEITWPAINDGNRGNYTLGGTHGSYYRLGNQDAIAHRGKILADGVIHVDVSFQEVPVFDHVIPKYPMGVTDLRQTRPASSNAATVSNAAAFAGDTKWYTSYTPNGSNTPLTNVTGTTGGAKFAQGTYTVEVKVKPVAGYNYTEGKTKFYFHFGVDEHVEVGTTASAGVVQGLIKNTDGTWTMYYTFKAVELVKIAHVNVSVPQPVVENTPNTAGTKIQALGTDNSDRTNDVTMGAITWYKGNTGTDTIAAPSKFEADGVYRAEFDLTTANNYKYLNKATPEDSIDVDFTVSGVGPIAGVGQSAIPANTVITSVTTKTTDADTATDTGHNADTKYHVVVLYQAIVGGKVALTDVVVDASPATKAGVEKTGPEVNPDKRTIYDLTRTADAGNPYNVTDNKWQYWNGTTWADFTGTAFAAGTDYRVTAKVELKDTAHYEITAATKFYLAGEECTDAAPAYHPAPGEKQKTKNADGSYTLIQEFSIPANDIDLVTVTYPEPVAGKSAQDFPDSYDLKAQVTIGGTGSNDSKWYTVANQSSAPTQASDFTGPALTTDFVDGTYYMVESTIHPNTGSGYAFKTDSTATDKAGNTQVTINGVLVTVDGAMGTKRDAENKIIGWAIAKRDGNNVKAYYIARTTSVDREIIAITATLTAPKTSGTPDTNVNTASAVNTEPRDVKTVGLNAQNPTITWGGTMTGDGKFNLDTVYTATFTYEAKTADGYNFRVGNIIASPAVAPISFTVNGITVIGEDTSGVIGSDGTKVATTKDSNDKYTITVTFPQTSGLEEIVDVTVDYTAPVNGQTPAASNVYTPADKVSLGDKHTVTSGNYNKLVTDGSVGSTWYPGNAATGAAVSGTFGDGNYTVLAHFVAEDGNKFVNTTRFVVNGSTYRATDANTHVTIAPGGLSATVWHTFSGLDKVVTRVVTAVTAPVAGASRRSTANTTVASNKDRRNLLPNALTSGGASTITWTQKAADGSFVAMTGTNFAYSTQYKADFDLTVNTADSYSYRGAGDYVNFAINGCTPELNVKDDTATGNTKVTGTVDGATVTLTKTSNSVYHVEILYPTTEDDVTKVLAVRVHTNLPPAHGGQVPAVYISPLEPYEEGLANSLKWEKSTDGISGWTTVAQGTPFEAGAYYRVTGTAKLKTTNNIPRDYDITTDTTFRIGNVEIPQQATSNPGGISATWTATKTADPVTGQYPDDTVYTMTLIYGPLTDNTNKIIKEVAANVLRPTAGSTLASNVVKLVARNMDNVSVLEHVEASAPTWTKSTDNGSTYTQSVTAGTAVGTGEYYQATFTVTAKDGYTFLNNVGEADYVDFLINSVLDNTGSWLNGASSGEGNGVKVTTAVNGDATQSYTVTVTFPMTGGTSDVMSVWGLAKVPEGNRPIQASDITVADEEPYEIVTAPTATNYWQHWNGTTWDTVNSGNFIPGDIYRAVMTVKMKSTYADKYVFTSTTQGYINDTTTYNVGTTPRQGTEVIWNIDAANSANSTIQLIREFQVPTQELYVRVSSGLPVKGNVLTALNGTIRVPAGLTDPHYTLSGGSWTGDTTAAGEVKPDTEYTMTVTVTPDAGYTLPTQLNGYYWDEGARIAAASTDNLDGTRTVKFTYRTLPDGVKALEPIITVKEPVKDDTPGVPTSPNESVGINRYTWTDKDGNPVTTFRAGGTYTVEVEIDPAKRPAGTGNFIAGQEIHFNSGEENIYERDGKLYVKHTWTLPEDPAVPVPGYANRPAAQMSLGNIWTDNDKFRHVNSYWTKQGDTVHLTGATVADYETVYEAHIAVKSLPDTVVGDPVTYLFNRDASYVTGGTSTDGNFIEHTYKFDDDTHTVGTYFLTYRFPATGKKEVEVKPGPSTGGTTTVIEDYNVNYWLSTAGTSDDAIGEHVAKNKSPKNVPNVTALNGYTFLGWSLDNPAKVAEPKLVDPKTVKITEDTTFYAIYKQEYDHSHYVIGFPDGTFGPDNNITRGQVATIIARACLDGFEEGRNYGNPGGYSDVSEHWAYSAISYCSMHDVFTGYEDGTFRPDDAISRQELATAVARLGEIQRNAGMPFADSADVAAWAQDTVYTAYANGWIQGYEDGTFLPENDIKRSETVKIFNGYLERTVNKEGLSELNEYVHSGVASNLQGGDKAYMTWPDVPETHWAYYEIIEAANDHDYHKADEADPKSTEMWETAKIDEIWRYHDDLEDGADRVDELMNGTRLTAAQAKAQAEAEAKAKAEAEAAAKAAEEAAKAEAEAKAAEEAAKTEAEAKAAEEAAKAEAEAKAAEEAAKAEAEAKAAEEAAKAEAEAKAAEEAAKAEAEAKAAEEAAKAEEETNPSETMIHRAYINGFEDGTFRPDASITRAAVASVIAQTLLEGYDPDMTYETDLVDLDEHWAKNYVAFCVQSGVFGGYEDNTFRPDQGISRQEFAVVLAKLSGLTGEGELTFSDSADVAGWAASGVNAAVDQGWLKGYEDGTFLPEKLITRAEAVKIFNSYLGRGVNYNGLSGVTGGSIWSDVAPTHWAYLEIVEAANDHTFHWRDADDPTPPERWETAGEI